MIVTLVLNNPPGGRCRLYRAYATVLVEQAGARCIEWFEGLPTQPHIKAPAVLIDSRPITPSDGVIVAPEDIGAAIGLSHPDAGRIVALLEGVVAREMQEWN